jgi:NitT/TauT family transport system substrate-binding protein
MVGDDGCSDPSTTPWGEYIMKRHFWGIAMALAAMTALATACSSAQGSPSSSSDVELHHLTIAAVPAADSVGLYIAVQDGLLAAQGIHVTIVPAISSETVIDQQLQGKYAITSGNYVSYMLANVKQHANFEILAAGSIMQPQVQELMIPPGSQIRTVGDLRGKTIALNALNGIGQLLVSATLEANMMSPSQVHFTTAFQFPDMALALKEHKVAAAFMPQPFATNAEDTVGAQPLADLDQGAVASLPISGYVVTKSWLQKYPKTAAAFRKALEEAQRIADTTPGAVEKAMVRYSKVSPTAAAISASPQFPLDTDRVLIQRVADLMQEFGLLHQSYNVSPMIP